MTDQVLVRFLERQLAEGVALARQSDLLELMPIAGSPPHRYLASYAARGLVQNSQGEIVEADRCDIMVWLPDGYLRRVDPGQVLTYMGPHDRPWHPNIRPPFICAHLRPGTPLVDLLYLGFELWTWVLYATGDDGLNPAAAQWARNQDPARFPVDRRPLRRRSLGFSVSVTHRTSDRGEEP